MSRTLENYSNSGMFCPWGVNIKRRNLEVLSSTLMQLNVYLSVYHAAPPPGASEHMLQVEVLFVDYGNKEVLLLVLSYCYL